MPVAGGGFGNLSSGRQQKAPQPESAISFSAKKRGANRVATTATRALRAGLTAGLNTRFDGDGEDERPPSPVKTQEPDRGKARNVSGHKIVEYDTKVASAPLPSGGFSWAQRAGGGRPAAAPARPQWHEEDEDESPAAEVEVEEKVEAIPNGVAPPAAPAAPVVPASAPASTPAPAAPAPAAAGGFSWAQRLGGGKAGQEGRRPSPSRQEVAKPPAQEVAPQRLPSPVVEEEPKQDFVPPTQVQAPAPPRPQRERSPPRGVTGRTAPAAPAAPAAVEKVEVKASAFDRMKAVSVPFDKADLLAGSAGWAPVNGVSQSKKPTITTEQSSALFHSQSEALVISDSILRRAPRSTGRRFTFSAPKAPSPALSPAVVPSPAVDAASKTPPQELVVPSAQPEAMPIAAVQAEVPHVPKVDQSTQGTSPLVFPAAQQQVYPSSAAVAPRVAQTSTVEAGTSPLFVPTLPNPAPTTNVVHATEYAMPAPPRGTVTQSKVYNRSQWGGASSAAPTVPVLPQTYGYQTQAQPQQPQPPQPQQPSRMVPHPAATGPAPSYSSGGMGGRMPAMPSHSQAALQTKRPGFGTMGMGDPSAYSKGPTSGMSTAPPGLQTGGRPGVSSGQRPMPPASFGTSPYSYNAYMYPQWMQPDAYNYQQYAAYSGTPSYPQGLPAATQYGYGQGGGYSAYPTAGYGAPSTQMSAPSWSSTGGRGGAPRQ